MLSQEESMVKPPTKASRAREAYLRASVVLVLASLVLGVVYLAMDGQHGHVPTGSARPPSSARPFSESVVGPRGLGGRESERFRRLYG
jgi:hypothetical protein